MRLEKIEAVLAEQQPDELEGVTARVEQEDQGPWLAVENHTGETLEIYGVKGEPFLRIGPEGVEGNRSTEEFYTSRPDRGVAPDDVRNNPDTEPEWVSLNDEPLWGWLDQRLATDGMNISEEVPMEIRRAREHMDVGEWSIPVRLGETETEVRGTYRYEPPPKGDYVARLISWPDSADTSVTVTHGAGPKALDMLFLQNRGEDPVTLFGRSGEPAIRIGPEEVQVNVNSLVGRWADRQSDSDASAGGAPSDALEGAPKWETVSRGASFGWIDPRLLPPAGQSEPPDDADAGDQEVARWEIPMQVAGEEQRLTGVTEWKPSEWEPPEVAAGTSGSPDQSGFREVATVVAVAMVPAMMILTILLGPGLYKRLRYRR